MRLYGWNIKWCNVAFIKLVAFYSVLNIYVRIYNLTIFNH